MQGGPAIRFAKTGDGRIAYQTIGSGPDVVAIPPFAQNIETAWQIPQLKRMLDRFASFSRYTHFDKRGVGASDRGGRVVRLDQRVEDLRAVMDAAGVNRTHLFAQSEGGPMALLFAATYPDRVDRIVLHGSGARAAPPDVDAASLEVGRERQAAFADAWGTPDSFTLSYFSPTLLEDRRVSEWWPTYERSAATRETLLDMFDQMLEMDVTDVLRDVNAPILLVHRTDDPAMPIAWAHEIVSSPADARLLELAGVDHYAFVGDLDEWMPAVERFWTGTISPTPAPQHADTVEVITLGTLEVRRNGEAVPVSAWGSRRARVLLARLAAARGWPVPREELIDMLWPDETDVKKLSARLSVQLSHLRRVLGGGVIADRATVALDLDHVLLDLVAIDGLDDDESVIDRLEHEFSPSDRYESWAEPLRAELDARLDRALRARREAVADDDVEVARLDRIRAERHL